jgi:two-component system response regulator FixJ
MADRPLAGRAMPGEAKVSPAGEFPKAADSSAVGALVCVVDDDKPVRDSFRTLLESLGFAVTTHASGRDILVDERRRQASCLIVDQHMPEMDGLTTLDALRREGLGVLTILMTGRLDPQIAARAAALEVDAILEKPFSATRLIELIRTHREPTR